MSTKSTKTSPQELTEADRLRIAEAREILQSYGQYVDVAEMSDVAYEQRACRMKALDAVCALADHMPPRAQWTALAAVLERYIWTGEVGDHGAV